MRMINNSYEKRCHRQLKEMNAPMSDWECVGMFDVEASGSFAGADSTSEGLHTCELCACPKVRFIHVMRHKDFPDDIRVGCICAGIMEGSILEAQERERQIRNRSQRKRNYLKRVWKQKSNGIYCLRYKNRYLGINLRGYGSNEICLICDGRIMRNSDGRRLASFLDAVHMAFNLVDPPIMKSDLEH